MDFFSFFLFFFFNDTATTEIYTLSLHDALPIFHSPPSRWKTPLQRGDTIVPSSSVISGRATPQPTLPSLKASRSEEHTSELQSRQYLVCRLLLEKKKNNNLYRKITHESMRASPY